jgi:hypothetical protein
MQRRALKRIAMLLLSALLAAPASAQSPEYRLKAAFLLNFAKFTTWPEPEFSSASQIALCIVGSDPFGEELASIEGKKVHGRDLIVRRGVKPEELKSCHVAFISDSEQPRLAQVIATLGSAAVLTVSDLPNFCEAGGAIALLTSGARVQFDVNLQAAERASLKLNPQVLKLAKTLHGSKTKIQ